jgi:hypothetical protein
MSEHTRYRDLIQMNARQVASALVRVRAAAHGKTLDQQQQTRIHAAQIHFHDDSTTQIAWNDVQAILMYNEHTGENLPVPLMATEAYNVHHHTSEFDGGYIPGMGPHDHRDNFNGGFCFSVYHPGTSLPQMPWAI